MVVWGGYNRTSRPAVQPAKIYLARPLPAALLHLTPAGVEEAGVEEEEELFFCRLQRLSSTPVGYPSCYGDAGVEEAGVEEGPHV